MNIVGLLINEKAGWPILHNRGNYILFSYKETTVKIEEKSEQ